MTYKILLKKPVEISTFAKLICIRLSIARLDTGPKRSMGHLQGGEKNNILIRGAEVVIRASGMRSIRGPEVSLGSLRVSTRRVQSPTPHTLTLGSYLPILSAVQLVLG